MGLKGFLFGCVLGGAIGSTLTYYANQDMDYRIIRSQNHVGLYCQDINRVEPLYNINGELYLGDSHHNLQGVRAVAELEGKMQIQPVVEGLQARVNKLERSIKARRFSDVLESVAEKIKEGYMNLRHNLME